MRVAELMSVPPTVVAPSDTLASARALMAAERLRCLPVVENKKLVGILTDRDIRSGGDRKSTRVSAVMTANPITIAPEATIEEAATVILQRKFGGLPVVHDDQLLGVITTTDLLKALLDLLRGTSKP